MVPSLFVCHGAPTLAIEDNDYTQYLQKLGKTLKPKAIVIFTAHWEEEITTLSFHDDVYDTIYDFGGFSDELYQIKYPAKGSTLVASMVEENLSKHGIPSHRDEKRGLDHGSWVVLRMLFPQADIPVVQISVNPYQSAEDQYKIGESLRELADRDIMVIGSGGTSHNLRMIKWGQKTPEKWTVEFDEWLINHIENRKLDSLFNYDSLAPHAQLAVPRAEHFVPLFIAFGSGSESKKPQLLHRSYDFGTLSHLVFEF